MWKDHNMASNTIQMKYKLSKRKLYLKKSVFKKNGSSESI